MVGLHSLVAERRHSSVTRYAKRSVACRDSPRHQPLRAGGTPLPRHRRLPTSSDCPTRRDVSQKNRRRAVVENTPEGGIVRHRTLRSVFLNEAASPQPILAYLSNIVLPTYHQLFDRAISAFDSPPNYHRHMPYLQSKWLWMHLISIYNNERLFLLSGPHDHHQAHAL